MESCNINIKIHQFQLIFATVKKNITNKSEKKKKEAKLIL
jgi:hypothetical protein